MIVDPVTMRPEQRISEALEVMANYKISGVPVTDATASLVGILTNRDLRFETRFDLPHRRADDQREPGHRAGRHHARAGARRVLHHHRIEKLLVVDEQRRSQGPDHGQGHPEGACSTRNACKDALGRLRVARGDRRSGRRPRARAAR